MIVKRGKNAYQYKSSRVNGEVKTVYQRKVSAEEFRACTVHKEKKQQQRHREAELARLHQELESALKVIKITERAYLLLAGFYERKSEIRKLQEEHCAQ
jgi:hypothetical protein